MIDIETFKSILSSNGYSIHSECLNCVGLDYSLGCFSSCDELINAVHRLSDLQTSCIPLTFSDCGMYFDNRSQRTCTNRYGVKHACTFYPGDYCAKKRGVLNKLLVYTTSSC